MSIGSLYNLDPRDKRSLLRWSSANMAEHFKIQNRVYAIHGLNLPLFPLDPLPPSDRNLVDWGRNHQTMHAQALEAAGIPLLYDLTAVDFTQPANMLVWIWEHADDHRRLALSLELT